MIKLDLATIQAISVYCWVVYLIALLIMSSLMLKTKYVGSSLITVAVITIVFLCMGSYERFMIPITKNKELVSEYPTLILYAWYYGFAVFAVISMVIIWRIHVAFIKPYSYLTRAILVLIGLTVVLQKSRLLERQSFNSEIIGEINYQWGIVLINITSACLVMIFALLAWFTYWKRVNIRGVV